jgi:Family of unknown function (DUF6167)
MRRLFWIAAGAAAGIYLARRVQRTAESLTPAGLADSLGGGMRELADAIRVFADDVKEAMGEREIELREALGLGEDEPADRDAR